MTSALQSTSEGCTLILTLSNPEFQNALSPDMYAAGIEALNAAENNPDVRSVIITGANSIFCAGEDFSRLQTNRRLAPDAQAQTIEGLHNWIDSIRTYPKPVLAAVEGTAAGAGFSLALACDFCIAAENATFVMSHSGFALSPNGGASWILARMLPHALANEWMMCGDRVSAQRLLALGLVNRVTGPGSALSQALETAEQLNSRAPNVLASIKELINDAPGQTLNQHLSRERDHFMRNFLHANGAEGIAAFVEKRKPHYR